MKLTFLTICATFILSASSCTKCKTCVPYSFTGGVVGAVDPYAQAIKVCDERDINSYETLNNFTDRQGDTVKFICH